MPVVLGLSDRYTVSFERSMGSHQFDRVREIFHLAVEVPAAERVAFLNETCDDSQMRTQVEALLKADQHEWSLFDSAAIIGIRKDLRGPNSASRCRWQGPKSTKPWMSDSIPRSR